MKLMRKSKEFKNKLPCRSQCKSDKIHVYKRMFMNQKYRPAKNGNHGHTYKQVAKRTGPLTRVQRRMLETQSQGNSLKLKPYICFCVCQHIPNLPT